MPLHSISDLLAAVDALPADDRAWARARIEAALDQPAPAARMSLGVLALDLAGHAGPCDDDSSDRLIVLPHRRRAHVAAAASV